MQTGADHASGLTCRAMSQIKPHNSRATATQTLFCGSLRPMRRCLKRLVSRSCARQERVGCAADAPQSSAQGWQARHYCSDKPRCLPPRFRYRNRDGVFVYIQSDEGSDSLFHGSVSRLSLQSDAFGRSACGSAPSPAQPTIRETDLSTKSITGLTRLLESGHHV